MNDSTDPVWHVLQPVEALERLQVGEQGLVLQGVVLPAAPRLADSKTQQCMSSVRKRSNFCAFKSECKSRACDPLDVLHLSPGPKNRYSERLFTA